MRDLDRTALVIMGAIALLAIAVRAYGIGWGLPLASEEAYPLKTAWSLWGWGPERGFDLNPRFFKYPSLTIYLQFLGQALLFALLSVTGVIRGALDFRLLYHIDPSAFYTMGRSITALFGAATVVPTYLLGARVAGRAAGAMAALLVAINVALVSKSQMVEVDVPLTFFVTLALLLALELAERPTGRNALVTGIAIGLATSCKYPGLFAVVPAALALAFGTARSRRIRGENRAAGEMSAAGSRPVAQEKRGVRKTKAREARTRPASASSGTSRPRLALALALGIVAALLVTSPYLLLDAGAFSRHLAAEREHMQLGHFGSEAGWSWGFYAGAWMQNLLGWPLGVAALLGLALFAARRERWAWMLGSFALANFAIVGSWSMKADRYLLPLTPVGAVFAGALVMRAIASRVVARQVAVRVGAGVAALALFAWPQAARVPAHLARLAPDTQTLATRWIETHAPAGSLIFSEAYGPKLLDPIQLAALDGELVARLCERSDKPLYAVQQLPLFQVGPERANDFYEPRFFALADVAIVTASVRDRYLAEPETFVRQKAIYDMLDRSWTRLQEIRGNGPDIVIYKNPAQAERLAARLWPGELSMLEHRTEAVGGEAFFYYNLGVNLEAYEFLEDALIAYGEGMRFGFADRASLMSITRALVRCYLRQNDRDRALQFLAEQAAQSRPEAEVGALRWLQGEVVAGRFVPTPLACAK